jgi:hypothetical protein
LTDWCLTQTLAIFQLYCGVRTTKKNIHDESVDWTCSDQQKGLQQKINKKLEENRDVFYKLEQEKLIKEKEIEKDKDKESSENDSSYIESFYWR